MPVLVAGIHAFRMQPRRRGWPARGRPQRSIAMLTLCMSARPIAWRTHHPSFMPLRFDDLMSAARYAIMVLRFASTKAAYGRFRRPIEYPRVGWCW